MTELDRLRDARIFELAAMRRERYGQRTVKLDSFVFRQKITETDKPTSKLLNN